MKSRRYLLAVILGLLFVVPTAFAEGTNEPGVIEPGHDQDPSTGTPENCWVCKGIIYEDGSQLWGCGKPDSGGWGTKRCEVETYPEGAYCISYGENCCVN